MKIAFLARYDFYEKFGGDTNQVEKYKKHWEDSGHDVDIIITKDFNKDYDVYIVVNVDRFLETFYFLKELKKFNLLRKTFLLAIHHSYTDIEYFEKNSRKGINGLLTNSLGFFGREKIKSIILSLKKTEYLPWALALFFMPIRKILKDINPQISFIFIALGEKQSLESDYKLKANRYILTRNGCDIESFERNESEEIDILISGRIEHRKNSLNIAKELSSLENKKIVFVGGENNNNKKYCKDFKDFISKSPNMEYIGKVKPEEVKSLYLNSKLHISASWFEVSSLVDLEAYYYGCNIISSTNGYTREFLTENAVYIDPKETDQLKSKIIESEMKKRDLISRRDYIEKYHSWERNSKKLLDDINIVLERE